MAEELFEEENNDFTRTPEFNKIYQNLIALVKPDDHREAASVIYGHYKEWSPSKTAKYYNLSEEIYEKYADMFKFKERMVKQMTGRKSKQDNIVNFLNGNVGKVVTPVQLATDVQISLPTFYNFYNANRGYFKKVKRGHFEILNPKEERASI
jgi:predicted Zn-dependent protease